MTPPDPARPRLVFLHIPKTAGTSLRAILAAAVGPDRVSAPFGGRRITEQQARDLDRFDAICGHMSRNDQIRWFPDRRVITTLREPIQRCLSWIAYVRTLPPTPVSDDARTLPLGDFITKNQRNLLNRMVRQLGGHVHDDPADFPALLERAKTTLREAAWVGQQETLSSDLGRLVRLMPSGSGELQMVRDNVTPTPFEVDGTALDQLRSMNEYDNELWHWARQHLGPPAGPVVETLASG